MRFDGPLIEARLVKRYKRFFLDARLDDGEIVTAHCANPGSMHGLLAPELPVLLSHADNPKRKLKFTWELVEVDGTLVGTNTARPNAIVAEAIEADRIGALSGYDTLRREVRYGRASRIDILLEHAERPPCYVEVKNVHMVRDSGRAEFPDSVTTRGAKHLDELARMVQDGARSVMVYLIQRADVDRFSLAADIDPNYASTFARARAIGIEAIALCSRVTTDGIWTDREVKIIMAGG